MNRHGRKNPMLLSAAIQLIVAVVSMLPSLIPRLLQAAVTLFTAIVTAVPMVVVLDYGSGNVRSAVRALERLGALFAPRRP